MTLGYIKRFHAKWRVWKHLSFLFCIWVTLSLWITHQNGSILRPFWFPFVLADFPGENADWKVRRKVRNRAWWMDGLAILTLIMASAHSVFRTADWLWLIEMGKWKPRFIETLYLRIKSLVLWAFPLTLNHLTWRCAPLYELDKAPETRTFETYE